MTLGEAMRAYCEMHDISDEQAAQKAQVMLKMWRLLRDDSIDGVFATEIRNVCRLVGYSADEALGLMKRVTTG